MTRRITWKKRLEPFGHLIYRMSATVELMSSSDLLQLENACKKASTTNVGWAEYWAAPMVAKMAREARNRRRRNALGKEGVRE